MTSLGGWSCFTNAIFVWVREKPVLGKVVGFRVDISIRTDLSIPKGCKFGYKY